MVPSLALVPVSKVPSVLEELKENLKDTEQCKELLIYFETNYIRDTANGKDAKFP